MQLGLVPQQWNSAVGLPLHPQGKPAAQRIVIGEFGQTANVDAVNLLLQQCGLPTVAIREDTNPWFPVASAPGTEATLDATIVASALPPNTAITVVNVAPSGDPIYSLLVSAAHACGLTFSADPRRAKPMLGRGGDFPPGGCIVSISYGGPEAATREPRADWMMDQLAQQGVIVIAAAGDEGSGGCIASTGYSYGTQEVAEVSSLSRSANQVVVTTDKEHGFHAGDEVFVTVPEWAPPVTARIAAVPTSRIFVFTLPGPDFAAISVSGSTAVGIGRLTPQYPASNPNALAVGGVQWAAQEDTVADGLRINYTPGVPYHPVAWRDAHPNSNCANVPGFTANSPTGGAESTGGGQSLYFPMPAYQSAAARRHYSTLPYRRMIPDISALAGWPTYAIANVNSARTGSCPSPPCDSTAFPWVSVVGTSAATPLIAVGIANVNAVLSAKGLPVIDNAGGPMDVHSILYAESNAGAITDVSSGTNDLFVLGGWRALRGYDMTTGLGVPNFRALSRLLVSRRSTSGSTP